MAGRPWRTVLLLVCAGLVVCGSWWTVGRLGADDRRLRVREGAQTEVAGDARSAASGRELRLLAWNLAHGRGDVHTGWLKNWRGGGAEARRDRLERMAEVLRRADADVVVLNEVDFRAGWSDGVNQAEWLARAAGYDVWVEQRNYDVRLPFAVYAFGNALLTRLPILDARFLELPPHAGWEALLVGSKAGAVVRLATRGDTIAVIPVHLDPRAPRTRQAAVAVLDSVRRASGPPVVLAGDFNASPPGWPEAGEATVVGHLLERGWGSPRAEGAPRSDDLTFPTAEPARALDWVLAEPPVEVLRSRVLEGADDLSDHAPVLAVLTLPVRGAVERTDDRAAGGGATP